MTRKPKNGKKFTNLELESIPPEWAGDILSDGEGLSGLVRVSKTKKISVRFQYIFRLKEKTTYFQCGSFPKNSIAIIRAARDGARDVVKKGMDPRLMKKAERITAKNNLQKMIDDEKERIEKNKTFNELFEIWVISGVSRKDGNKSIIQSFNKYILPAIGSKLLSHITDQDLFGIFNKVATSGQKRTADILFKTIRQMFGWAELRQPWRDLLVNGNPAKLVNRKVFLKDYEEERDRVLSNTELRLLKKIFLESDKSYEDATDKLHATRPIQKTTQIGLWISLSTLCRTGEMLKAEWSHVNFDSRIWHIPAENTKKVNKTKQTDHNIYLSDFVLDLFKQLKSITGDNRWLFPSKIDPTKNVNDKTISKQVGDRQIKFKNRQNKIRGRVYSNDLVLGDEDWTPHDMRRTGATIMQQLKIDPNVIDKCQHHALPGSRIRKHYQHYQYEEEMKAAWSLLGERIYEILSI